MNPCAIFCWCLATGLLAAAGSATPGRLNSATDSVLNFTLVADRQELLLDHRGFPLLGYAFGTNQFKPYVRELYAFNGVNVLRDAPADHLHHHGLMYAIKVNGTNFWEESPAAGYQRPGREVVRTIGRDPAGRPRARLSHSVFWVFPGDANLPNPAPAALLVEKRTLTVTLDEAAGEVVLEWRGDFEVGPATPKVTLGGTMYHGLGLRLPEAFDRVARHGNSEDAPYSAEQKADVIAAKWATVAGKVDGRNTVLALFSHPSNRGPSKFFSMIDGFAYLSATQGLDTGPIEYSAGEKFSLRYLLTVYPAPKSKEFFRDRWNRWASE